MNSESVDLIATDPPFNKGRDFHATPDSLASGASFQDRWSWDEDVHPEWVDQITDDFPKLMEAIECARYAHSDAMGAYVCFMAVRLLEMRRILREDGSIYLHCDSTASHYLKTIMDAIFGNKNFRNEVVWRRDNTVRGAKKNSNQWPRCHDNILFYTKAKKWKFDLPMKQLTEKQIKTYRYTDEDGRKYRTSDLGDYSKESIEELRKQGLIHVSKNGGESKKYFLDEARGTPYSDIWTDIQGFGPRSQAREVTGFRTQKPLCLYERIIKASTKEGDMVLDPFAGCATTCVAAERSGRQWVGIDIWTKAKDVVIERLEEERLIAPEHTRRTKRSRQQFLFTEDMRFTSELPIRTDEGEEAVPFLKTKLKVDEPKDKKRTRAEKVEYLLGQQGCKCQGCDRKFDDPRYLELDHNTPRSDGGLNHISNRILLCGPCNKLKSNTYTLSGLRRQNKKLGYMAGQQATK